MGRKWKGPINVYVSHDACLVCITWNVGDAFPWKNEIEFLILYFAQSVIICLYVSFLYETDQICPSELMSWIVLISTGTEDHWPMTKNHIHLQYKQSSLKISTIY